MGHDESEQSDYDSDEEQKVVCRKPQVSRLDKIKNVRKITINLSMTQYPVIADVAEELNWRLQYDTEAGDWDLFWTDFPIDTDTLIKMHLFQKINYYPGIHTIARKNLLGLRLMALKQHRPQDYDFFPQTWMLPQQYAEFRHYFESRPPGKTRTYIVKPEADCQGRGIFLTRRLEDLQNGKHYVVQRYITKPYLIEGLKFDLRIYVLLCGSNPLRLYIYEDGLGRFATEKYSEPTNENLEQEFMHLTNYAINKKNPKYVFNRSSTNVSSGHKRSLKAIYELLERRGADVGELKRKVNDLIIKTVISGLPLMAHQYRCCQPEDYCGNMCFHVLGFDVMLNERLQPQLIEVNHTPSFATDTPLDYKVKFALVRDTLRLMRVTTKQKTLGFNRSRQINQNRLQNRKRPILEGEERLARISHEQQSRDEYQDKHLGGYTRIYPPADQQTAAFYGDLIELSTKLHFAENTPIRIKMEELEKKNSKSCRVERERGDQPKTITAQKLLISKERSDHSETQGQQSKMSKNNFQQLTVRDHKTPQKASMQKELCSQEGSSACVNRSKKQKQQLSGSTLWSEKELRDSIEKQIFVEDIQTSSFRQTKQTRDESLFLSDKGSKQTNPENGQKSLIGTTGLRPVPRPISIEKELLQKEGQTSTLEGLLTQSSKRKLERSFGSGKKISSTESTSLPQKTPERLCGSQIRKISRESKSRQLPNIYQNSSCDIGGALGLKDDKLKSKRCVRQGLILNSIAQQMGEISKRPRVDSTGGKAHKNISTRQMAVKNTVYKFGKGNHSSGDFNKEQILINSGAFLMPRIYNLNVSEHEKRVQTPQSLFNIMAKSRNAKESM